MHIDELETSKAKARQSWIDMLLDKVWKAKGKREREPWVVTSCQMPAEEDIKAAQAHDQHHEHRGNVPSEESQHEKTPREKIQPIVNLFRPHATSDARIDMLLDKVRLAVTQLKQVRDPYKKKKAQKEFRKDMMDFYGTNLRRSHQQPS